MNDTEFVDAGSPGAFARALMEALSHVAYEGDIVAGKGVISGVWRIGRYVGPASPWVGDAKVIEDGGAVVYVKASTLRLLEVARAE